MVMVLGGCGFGGGRVFTHCKQLGGWVGSAHAAVLLQKAELEAPQRSFRRLLPTHARK